MARTAWKQGSTGSQATYTGTAAWQSGGAGLQSGGQDSVGLASAGTYSYPVRLTGFGFTSTDLPAGAIICGVEVRFNRAISAIDTVNDVGLYLIRNNLGTSADRCSANKASAVAWPLAGAWPDGQTAYYGDILDDWTMTSGGLADNRALALSADFGIELQVKSSAGAKSLGAYVQYVEMRLHYYVPPEMAPLVSSFSAASGATWSDTVPASTIKIEFEGWGGGGYSAGTYGGGAGAYYYIAVVATGNFAVGSTITGDLSDGTTSAGVRNVTAGTTVKDGATVIARANHGANGTAAGAAGGSVTLPGTDPYGVNTGTAGGNASAVSPYRGGDSPQGGQGGGAGVAGVFPGGGGGGGGSAAAGGHGRMRVIYTRVSATTGTLSGTLGALTLSTGGTLALSASLSATLAALDIIAVGTEPVVGDFSGGLAVLTGSAAGTHPITGDGLGVLSDLSFSGAGTFPVIGVATVAFASLTQPDPRNVIAAAGDDGVFYDPSDLSSMFQDSAGTIPAVVDSPVGLMLDKSSSGRHLVQATGANRPILRNAGSLYWLDFSAAGATMTVSSGAAYPSPMYLAIAWERLIATDASLVFGIAISSTEYFRFIDVATSNRVQGGIRDSVAGAAVLTGASGCAPIGVPLFSDLSAFADGTLEMYVQGGTVAVSSSMTHFMTGANVLSTGTITIGPGVSKFYGGVILFGDPTAGRDTIRKWLSEKAGMALGYPDIMTGTMALVADSSLALGAATFSGNASDPLVANGIAALGDLVAAAAGTFPVTAQSSLTFDGMALDVSGGPATAVAFSATLDPATFAGDGTMATAVSFTGLLDTIALATAGVLSMNGAVDVTLGGIVPAFAGAAGLVGDLNALLADATFLGDGGPVTTLDLNVLLGNLIDWTPLILGAKLLAWWKAPTPGSNATLDVSGSLASWVDEVGGYSLVNATVAEQPMYSAATFNGDACAEFDGVDDALKVAPAPAGIPSGAASSELWAHIRQDRPKSSGTTSFIVGLGGSNTLRRREISRITGGVLRASYGDASVTTNSDNANADLGGYHVVRGVFDNAVRADIDGVAGPMSGAVVGSTLATQFTVGAAGSFAASSRYLGGIRQVLVTAPLTDEEAGNLIAYLNGARISSGVGSMNVDGIAGLGDLTLASAGKFPVTVDVSAQLADALVTASSGTLAIADLDSLFDVATFAGDANIETPGYVNYTLALVAVTSPDGTVLGSADGNLIFSTVAMDSAGGPSTQAVLISRYLDDATATVDGALDNAAVVNAALGSLVVSAAVAAAISVTLDTTLAPATFSGAGTIVAGGTLDATLGGVMVATDGSLALVGAATLALGALVTTADGSGALVGDFAVTLAPIALAADAGAGVLVDLSVDFAAASILTDGTAGIAGAFDAAFAPALGAGDGTVETPGAFDAALGPLTAAAAVAVDLLGGGAFSLDPALLLSDVGVAVRADADNGLAALILTGIAVVDVAVSLNVTLGSLALAIAGVLDVAVSLNATLGVASIDTFGTVLDAPFNMDADLDSVDVVTAGVASLIANADVQLVPLAFGADAVASLEVNLDVTLASLAALIDAGTPVLVELTADLAPLDFTLRGVRRWENRRTRNVTVLRRRRFHAES